MKKWIIFLSLLAVFLLIEALAMLVIVEAAKVSLKIVADSPLSQRAVWAVLMFAFVFTVATAVAVAAVTIICLAVELLMRWNYSTPTDVSLDFSIWRRA